MMYRITAYDNQLASLEFFGSAPLNLTPTFVGVPASLLAGIEEGANLKVPFTAELSAVAVANGGFVRLFAIPDETYGQQTKDTDSVHADASTTDSAADAGTDAVPAEVAGADEPDESAVPTADSELKRSVFSKPAAIG